MYTAEKLLNNCYIEFSQGLLINSVSAVYVESFL
jgi:hypothetical protein